MSTSTNTTAPSPTSTRRSSSTRITCAAYYDRGIAYGAKGDADQRDRRLRSCAQARPEERHRAQQSRPRLSHQGRRRPRHRRFRRGDQAQPGLCRPRFTIAPTPISTATTSTAPSPTSTQAIKLDDKDALAWHDRGLAYYEKRDIARAIADFETAIKLNPNYAIAATPTAPAQPARLRPRRHRGRAVDPSSARSSRSPITTAASPVAGKNELDRAIADFDRALKINPNLSAAYYNRGNAYFQKRDSTAPSPATTRRSGSIRRTRWPTTTAASRITNATTTTAPSRISTSRSSSTARTPAPGTTAASPGTRSATTTAPSPISTRRSSSIRNSPPPTARAATRWPAMGDFDKAIVDLTQAIKLDGSRRRSLQRPRHRLRPQGRHRPRRRRLRPGRRRSTPKYAPTYNNRGIAYRRQGPGRPRHPGLRARRSSSTPRYAAAFYNRGNAKYDKGDYAGAIADYDGAIKLDPDDAQALNNRGNAYANRRDFDRAIADLTQALKLRPDYAQGHNDRGVAFAAKGDLDRARRRLRAGGQSSTRRMPSPGTIAASPTATSRDLDRAIQSFDEAIKLNPNYAAAYYNRGNALEFKRDYDARHRRLRPARSSSSRISPRAWYDRGLSYGAKGDADRAIADLAESIKRDGKDASAFYNRGIAWRLKGDVDKAIADFGEAVKLDAKFALALSPARQRLLREARLRPRHRRSRPRRSATIPTTTPAYATRALAYREKQRLRSRHQRLQPGDQARSEGRRAVRQSRAGLAHEGRPRPRHRRFRPGGAHRSEVRRRLPRPRHRLRHARRCRPRHRRFRRRDQARAEERRRL